MTDPDLTPAEGDTPGPFATPAQDADVRALLGTLRAQDVPMPDDVVRRINAAVVAERVASTLPDSPAALVDTDEAAARTGSVTVLPTAEQRRGPSYRGLTRLVAVAAAILVVVGVGAVLKSTSGGGSASSTAGAGAEQAPTAADANGGSAAAVPSAPRLTSTGTEFSALTLKSQAQALASGVTPASATLEGSSPQPTRAASSAYAAALPTGATLDRCITAIAGRSGVSPIAVDSGTYGGEPAIVIVLPTEDDATSLDVWVVAPGCGSGGEPGLLEFQRVPRS